MHAAIVQPVFQSRRCGFHFRPLQRKDAQGWDGVQPVGLLSRLRNGSRGTAVTSQAWRTLRRMPWQKLGPPMLAKSASIPAGQSSP
jgi:hypothetical protein